MPSDNWTDSEFRRLGSFVKKFYAPPSIDTPRDHSSFRDDLMLRTIVELATEKGVARVLDVCCGRARVAEWLSSLPNGIAKRKVAYCGTDQNIDEVDDLGLAPAFLSFKVFNRKAHEVDGLPTPFDIILVMNALHEIGPHYFAQMIEALNGALEEQGQMLFIDMETLPIDEEESVAIPWKGSEIEELLSRGGFQPAVTPHPKLVNVFCASAKKVAEVKRDDINSFVRTKLREKLNDAWENFRISGIGRRDIESIKRRVVESGRIARCTEELRRLGGP